jgi:hypothetical protein
VSTRDPARIDATLRRLRLVWEAHPDWRLGQLIFNAAAAELPGRRDVGEALFAIEDDLIAQGLVALLAEDPPEFRRRDVADDQVA